MRKLLTMVLGAGLLAAPVASAQTYCVYSPSGCVGVVQPTVAAAMAAAAFTPERDLVRVGPGDFLEPNWPGSGQQIDIVGSGRTQTIIRPQATGTLFQVPSGGALSDVGFVAIDGGGTLLQSSGFITGIRVTSSPTFNGTGVTLSDNGHISNSTIILPTGGGTTAILGQGTGARRATDVDVQAGIGISGGATNMVVTRARVTAGRHGMETSGTLRVETALIRMVNEAGFLTGAGLLAESRDSNGIPADLIANHVTILGSGRVDEAGADALGNAAGLPATITLRDSIVRGATTSVRRTAGAGPASIIATFSLLDPASAVSTGAGGSLDIFSPTNQNVDPGFVNAAGGDFRLSAGSPVRDVGSFAGLGVDESATDLDANPRILDAAGVCGAAGRRDIGAFEFVPPVRAGAAVAPLDVGVGVPATFTASGSCDPGSSQAPIIEWAFDDGTVATGNPVAHAFATPGTHQATVTVRRANGASSASASVSLVVKDITAPRMTITTSATRLTRTGIARIGLRCPAAELSGPCRGTLTLRTATKVPVRVGGRTVQRIITVGSVTFSIGAGQVRTVSVRISAAGRALIATRRSLRVVATAAARDSVGNRQTVTRITTLRPALVP